MKYKLMNFPFQSINTELFQPSTFSAFLRKERNYFSSSKSKNCLVWCYSNFFHGRWGWCSVRSQSSINLIRSKRWDDGWLVKCFIYLHKNKCNQRNKYKESSRYQESCDLGVDRSTCGHQLSEEGSSVSLFIGVHGVILSFPIRHRQNRDAT